MQRQTQRRATLHTWRGDPRLRKTSASASGLPWTLPGWHDRSNFDARLAGPASTSTWRGSPAPARPGWYAIARVQTCAWPPCPTVNKAAGAPVGLQVDETGFNDASNSSSPLRAPGPVPTPALRRRASHPGLAWAADKRLSAQRQADWQTGRPGWRLFPARRAAALLG